MLRTCLLYGTFALRLDGFAKINTRIYLRESLSFVVLNSTLRNYENTIGSRIKLVDPGEGVFKNFVFRRVEEEGP